MKLLFFLLFTICFTCSAQGQSSDEVKKDAAFLFAYYPKDGLQQEFEEGYKSHLEWHQNYNDPLTWYGWYVVTGERTGMFVDGTFGLSFESFDNRISPAEDADHFSETTAPYANDAFRSVFRLKSDLSTTTRLEDQTPSSSIEVYTFSIIPGREHEFEEVISELVNALRNDDTEQEFTVYHQLTGGELPAYMLMVPHTGFADFASKEPVISPGDLIHHLFNSSTAEKLLNKFSGSVRKIYGETWSYRSDLSYFPRE